ncbi:uncharacterized protein QC764_704050 [Podospora pseudoanserina]|uniref:DUF676 domain-containing protein n=1 Tax=Podospora pseudoanserina TaxID=2609844 RepID=A0ABR0HIX8_9PEZI|nr:hypothetical protein QC764_704050 [Podospora pseudoanserina]
MAQPKRMLIKELHTPDSSDLDLVLIHGLNGDPIETWRHQDTKQVWPQALLPDARPKTRVLSYGYNGDIYLNNSAANIRDMARSVLSNLDAGRRSDPHRPIIFVAHCLGGLIIKQALCFARAERRFHNIGDATKAVFFFGTPHSGAKKQDWKRIAESYSVLSPRRGSVAPIVNAITTSAPRLVKLCDDFVELTDRYLIVTWYETVFWPGTKKCIVDQTSARMMAGGNEEAMPVEADHVNMCRFAGGDDPTLQELLMFVQRALGKEERMVPLGQIPTGEVSGTQGRTARTTIRQPYTIFTETVRERHIMVGTDLTGQVYSQQRSVTVESGASEAMTLGRVEEVEDDNSNRANHAQSPSQIGAPPVSEAGEMPWGAKLDASDSGRDSRRPNFLKRFAGRLRSKQTLIR